MFSTYARVAVIVSSVTGKTIQEVSPGVRWNDIGADELDLAEIYGAVESEFLIELTDSDTEYLATVGDLVAVIEKKMKVTT